MSDDRDEAHETRTPLRTGGSSDGRGGHSGHARKIDAAGRIRVTPECRKRGDRVRPPTLGKSALAQGRGLKAPVRYRRTARSNPVALPRHGTWPAGAPLEQAQDTRRLHAPRRSRARGLENTGRKL